MSPALKLWSSVLGLLDYVYCVVRLIPALAGKQRPLFFSKGWGDVNAALAFQEDVARIRSMPTLELEACGAVKGRPSASMPSTVFRAVSVTFASPSSRMLPEESHLCDFNFYAPRACVDEGDASSVCAGNQAALKGLSAIVSRSSGLVILCAATGEATKRLREPLALKLCTQLRCCVVVLTAPLYGRRQPKAQSSFHVTTVADLIIQSSAAMHEAAAIAGVIVEKAAKMLPPGASLGLCFSGFSWGGATASGAALLAARWLGELSNVRVVVVPYCGSISPIVLADGILLKDLSLAALREVAESPVELITRLRALLQRASLEALEDSKGAVHVSGAVVVGAGNDAFVTSHHTRRLHEFWKSHVPPGSFSAQWIAGGHVAGFLFRTSHQFHAIKQALSFCESKM